MRTFDSVQLGMWLPVFGNSTSPVAIEFLGFDSIYLFLVDQSFICYFINLFNRRVVRKMLLRKLVEFYIQIVSCLYH